MSHVGIADSVPIHEANFQNHNNNFDLGFTEGMIVCYNNYLSNYFDSLLLWSL